MTYCVGIYLQEGLVFATDSRTNAGTDYVTTYSKMHWFKPANDRVFMLLSAGNLATTQEIINRIKRDLDFSESNESLLSARYMFEAADYIGRVSVDVQQNHGNNLSQAGVSGESSLILGGQIQGHPHKLMMIYPQGNYIEASETTPFLQIGETKYGKPVLDRVLNHDTSLKDAAKLALVSLTSTANSNITVGPPFELASYQSGDFQLLGRCKFEGHGDFITALEQSWRDGLNQVFNQLPDFDWNLSQQEMELEIKPEILVSNS